jgi:tRNA-specific 2-thiouridylase
MLEIPHYVLDYEARFRSGVIEVFADSYIRGETPIPCVSCNTQIKFADLLQTAIDLQADALATGHYIERRGTPGQKPTLHRAADGERDQSYFLYATTAAQLSRLLFPLGTFHKSDIRAMAHELGLPVAAKSDSQDICFVPSGRYADVIERLRPGAAEAGDIVHVDGRVLGRHAGIINFTVGQRRGLGIASHDPLYVVRLDAQSRRVIVGPRDKLETHWLFLRDVNWIGDGALRDVAGVGLPVAVRMRSSQAPVPATLFADADGVRAVLDASEFGISAGQACVFYDSLAPRARLLGGGTIARALRRSDVAASEGHSPDQSQAAQSNKEFSKHSASK